MKIAGIMLVADPNDIFYKIANDLKPYVDFLLCVVSDEKTERKLNLAGFDTLCIDRKRTDTLRNAADYALRDHLYHLHVDTDEIFDRHFLSEMRYIISRYPYKRLFMLKRVNLFDGKNYPDFQGRFFRYENVIWKRYPHEYLYSKKEDVTLDSLGAIYLNYNIIHLPRRRDISRPWWEKK